MCYFKKFIIKTDTGFGTRSLGGGAITYKSSSSSMRAIDIGVFAAIAS